MVLHRESISQETNEMIPSTFLMRSDKILDVVILKSINYIHSFRDKGPAQANTNDATLYSMLRICNGQQLLLLLLLTFVEA